ncbi:hypothetical protein U9M48_033636 [Paspalum notatum var. saurae]|uniref:Uncharacterized protein n=1 Tax=Paspalum notatum var. saurae TaxID=547442 RepID=A0AAQ3U7X3_PASNO
MGRSPCCCHDAGVKKGPWTEEEDRTLVEHIQRHGGHVGSWRNLPKAAGLNRCGKSCRLRWTNYLRPDIKRGNFTGDEEALIIRLHAELGNKWSTIATHLDGRTDNEIKNYWNTHIRKKLLRMRIDPVTHQRLPPDDVLSLGGALAASPAGLPEVLVSAAASLGGLNTALMQAQALQLLLQAITGGAAAGSLVPSASSFNSASSSAAADDAILCAGRGGVVPSFGHQDHQMMNLLLSHASYTPPRPADCHGGNIIASEVQQLMNASAPVAGATAEPPPPPAAALVPASCPEEVASAADRPVHQAFADLLSEPIEMPGMCSLEDDLFWRDILESSSLPL